MNIKEFMKFLIAFVLYLTNNIKEVNFPNSVCDVPAFWILIGRDFSDNKEEETYDAFVEFIASSWVGQLSLNEVVNKGSYDKLYYNFLIHRLDTYSNRCYDYKAGEALRIFKSFTITSMMVDKKKNFINYFDVGDRDIVENLLDGNKVKH